MVQLHIITVTFIMQVEICPRGLFRKLRIVMKDYLVDKRLTQTYFMIQKEHLFALLFLVLWSRPTKDISADYRWIIISHSWLVYLNDCRPRSSFHKFFIRLALANFYPNSIIRETNLFVTSNYGWHTTCLITRPTIIYPRNFMLSYELWTVHEETQCK